MTDHDCPHAVTLRNLLDACDRGRPLADITDRLRVEVGRLGGEGTAQPDPSRPVMADGAHLFFAVYMPDVDPQDENNDPDMIADALVGIINEERVRNAGADAVGFDSPEVKPVMVSGIPAPQWLTPETLANLKRAASGEGTAPPPDEDHGVRLVHFGCDECKQVGRVVTKLGPECLHCDLPRGHAGDCVPMVWPQPGTTPRIEPVRIDTPDDDERGAPQVPAEADQHAILRSWGWAPTLAGDTWLPPREPETERLCSKSFARPPENHTTPVPDSEGWGSCNACGAVLNTQGQQVPQHDVRVVAADCAPPEETET